ncbi:MAG: hypothetical protein HY904_15595 [Deltaproteobacteria bacterium]|nr:hypothetical protein [Deltaproteobacteria bacterium]
MTDRIETLLSEGLGHFVKGDNPAALRCWDEVLLLDPGNVRAREFLAYVRTSAPPQAPSSPAAEVASAPAPPPPPAAPPPAPPPPAAPPAPAPAATAPQWSPMFTPGAASSGLPAGPVSPGLTVIGSPATPGPWDAVSSPPTPMPQAQPAAPPAPRMGVVVQGDANADGLHSMWEPPAPGAPTASPPVIQPATRPNPTPAPKPAAAAAAPPSPPVVTAPPAAASPWDDGPAAGAAVTLDPSGAVQKGGNKARPAAARASAGAGAGAGDVKSRCAAMMARVKELHDLGDFSGSLEIVEKVLELDPQNAEARDYMERNEETLLQMYLSKLGPLERTPRMRMTADQVIWLNLHHKAGFLLSRVDGMSSFDDILSLSAMPRLETVRILAQLLSAGVIAA